MKLILTYLLLLPCLLFGQSLFLTDAVSVSLEGNGSRAPRIALLDGNRPVVYWGKPGGNSILYLAVWENGSFGAPIALNTNGISPDLWGGGLGPQITARGNTIFLVFENYGTGIFCIKSDDGGQTFSNPVSVFVAPQGRVATLPSIAVDSDLNPIISFVTTNFSEEDAQYEITKSTDGGLTFPITTVANLAAPGTEVCECCPASIGVVSNEEFYLGFRNNFNDLRDIWVSKSEDSGLNFTAATDIDYTDWTISACPQSGPDLMVNGDSIFTVFFSGATGNNIYFSSLNKTNMEKGYQFQITTASGQELSQNYPAIAGNGDTLAIAWQESGDNGLDIQLAWSVNGSDDLLNNRLAITDLSASQKQPDIAYKDGKFHIVYEDQATGQVMYSIASFEEIIANNNITYPDFAVDITPNPFSKQVSVNIANDQQEIITATLLSSHGQQIATYQTSGNTLEINEPAIETGVYFLKIQKGKALTIKKLIKS